MDNLTPETLEKLAKAHQPRPWWDRELADALLRCAASWQVDLALAAADRERLEAYEELIYAVETKHEGETGTRRPCATSKRPRNSEWAMGCRWPPSSPWRRRR